LLCVFWLKKNKTLLINDLQSLVELENDVFDNSAKYDLLKDNRLEESNKQFLMLSHAKIPLKNYRVI